MPGNLGNLSHNIELRSSSSNCTSTAMAPPHSNGISADEEEEDDYMNMAFDDAPAIKESSLQRTQRLKKEAKERGLVKSKAQRAEEEVAARDKALSTSLLEDPRATKSKGLAMMSKMGFTGGGLGKKDEGGTAHGRTEPINVNVKEDRGGIGLDSERKRLLREAAEEMAISNKAVKLDPDEYRERMRKEREDAKKEKQLYAAQRMAERMEDELAEGETSDAAGAAKSRKLPISSRPLKSLPVEYRGLVKYREEQERGRRMRHDLEQSLSQLPSYDDSDEDEDDKKALGKRQTIFAASEDLDEEDEELDRFNETEIGERLTRLLTHLRETHRYCFWCKMAYPDKQMEGCPGLTEDDHD